MTHPTKRRAGKSKRVWIVEANFAEWDRDRWEPTVGMELTRDDARVELSR